MIRIIEYGALTSTKGGIESYIYNQISAIKNDDDNKNKIIFDFLVPAEKEKLAYEDQLREYGCKIYRGYRRWKDSFFGHYIDLYHFFKKHRSEYDIAVGNYLDFQNINFLIIAKLFGITTIAHAHNANVPRNLKFKIFVFINQIIGLFFVDSLFTCSSVAAKWMFGNLLLKKNKRSYFQINNRINVDKFRFSKKIRNEIREKLGISADTIVLGNSGRMVAQKNQLFLVDIFFEYLKINKNAKLIILGDGILRQDIVERIKSYNISEKVILTGSVSNVSDWLQGMDVFVFPSVFEGLGMSAIESQAAGLMTFVSDKVPQDVNISPLYHCLSLKQSPKEWAEEISIYDHYLREDTYENIDSNGYNVIGAVNKYVHIYNSVLKRKESE